MLGKDTKALNSDAPGPSTYKVKNLFGNTPGVIIGKNKRNTSVVLKSEYTPGPGKYRNNTPVKGQDAPSFSYKNIIIVVDLAIASEKEIMEGTGE
jgi:hypothetical protein